MIKKLRLYKQKINIFVALVVFLNAIAPLSVVAQEFSDIQDNGIEALYGDKILICTPAGFKYISIDELNDFKTGEKGAEQSHCPLCQINFFSSILALVDFNNVQSFLDQSANHEVNAENRLLKLSSICDAIKARAPPFFL